MITIQPLVSCDRNLLWLDQIENSDTLVPLKYATRINAETLLESTPSEFLIKYIDIGSVDSTGKISQVEEFTFKNSPSRARRRVKQGNTIVSTVRTYLKAIAYIDQNEPRLIASTGFAVLEALKNTLCSRYLYYWMRSDFVVDEVCARSVGVSYPATNASEIGAIPVPILPIEKQQSIARFLDRKTAAIDTLIAKKQRLIQLLEEKRTALINQAVTKGLNSNAPMKDSGIPWIGEIPQHWEVKNLKRVCRKITDGEHISPNLSESGVPLLSAKDIRDREIQYDVDKFISYEDAERFIRLCKPSKDDLLIVSRGATIGRVAVIDGDQFFCLMGSVILLKLNIYAHPIFLYFLLNKTSIKEELLLTSSSSAQQAIYLVDVADLVIQLPPMNELCEIANYLDNFEKQFQAIIGNVEKQIEKLQEYRRSLITAAVTGKLEISEVEADV